MKRFITGYTTGVFDLFHIGHLNILKSAKKRCDHLIVGVTTDEEVLRIKGKKPIIPFNERIEIVQAIQYVDEALPENNVDKLLAWEKYKFNAIFKGDDWKGSPKWLSYEQEFTKRDVEVIYFPYTKETSSTQLRKVLSEIIL